MTRVNDILMISGSQRSGSVNTAVLRAAQDALPAGVRSYIYSELGALPHFSPDAEQDPLPSSVVDLRNRIGAADGILISTPEYAGALPGSFKNLLDWSVGGGETYMKPVAWFNASTAVAGAAHAHESLRIVLGYVGTVVVEEAVARVPVARGVIDSDGVITDQAVRDDIAVAVAAFVTHIEEQGNQ